MSLAPGPGKYTFDSCINLKSSPKYKIGNACRDEIKTKDKIPEAGRYNPNKNVVLLHEA
jgi:hypothetical protein